MAEYFNKSKRMPGFLTKILVLINSFIDRKYVKKNSVNSKVETLEEAGKNENELDKIKRVETNANENVENRNRKENETVAANLVALNYLAFLCLFLIIFSCDLAFWLMMIDQS
jgi:hypothetical protein